MLYYDGGDVGMDVLVRDQLNKLYQLLASHQVNHTATISDYQQIKRIVQSLTANEQIHHEQLSTIFPEIYHYGLQGESVPNLKEHIETNYDSIEKWMETIDTARFTLE